MPSGASCSACDTTYPLASERVSPQLRGLSKPESGATVRATEMTCQKRSAARWAAGEMSHGRAALQKQLSRASCCLAESGLGLDGRGAAEELRSHQLDAFRRSCICPCFGRMVSRVRGGCGEALWRSGLPGQIHAGSQQTGVIMQKLLFC